ncbi:hypothetical protein D3C72_1597000 [compost metagenome]
MGHRIRVARQGADGTVDPPRHNQPYQQGNPQQRAARPKNAPLAAVDHRRHSAVRFPHRQHADDFSPINNGCRHVHHGALRVVGIVLGTARAVLPAQGAPDIIPARIILSQPFADGIKHHFALRVGHVDVIFVAHFVDAANVGAKRALMQLREGLRNSAVLGIIRQQIVAPHFRQQRGGINQCPLGSPAYAGFHLLHKDRQHKPGGDCDNQEIAQQQPHADAHYDSPRL